MDARLAKGLQAFGEAYSGKTSSKHTIEGSKARYASRQAAVGMANKREAALAQALQTESGIRRIAANMANPVFTYYRLVMSGIKIWLFAGITRVSQST